MKENVYHSGDMSTKSPAWYWTGGLHDAQIVSVEQLQLPYDYKERNPIRNSMKLLLDSSQALHDTTIKSITLLNYKVMTSDIELKNCYWLQDVLTFENGKYILNITVTDCRKHDIFTVGFENAIVERSH